MTKEEYKRNLIRMFDSIRDEYKGEENCAGVNCGYNCPFFMKVCGFGKVKFHVYEAIETVENWAKEHPVVTNADKFEEVFGVEAPMNRCIKNDEFCTDCEYYEFGSEPTGCKADERFWNAEYKEQKKEGADNERND